MTVTIRRPLRAAVLVATAALTLVAGSVFGQADPARLIPAGAAYAAYVPGTTQLWDAWKKNAAYQSFHNLMQEPEFKEKTQEFGQEVKTIEEALGFQLNGETLSKTFSDTAVYIATGANAGEASIGIAATVQDRERLTKLLDLAEKAAVSAAQTTETETAEDGETTGPTPITSEDYEGVTVKRFAVDEDSEFYYAVLDKLFLGASSQEEIKALIGRAKGGDAKDTLAADANYKKLLTGVAGQEGEAYFYANNKAAAELQQNQPGMDKFRELMRKIAPVDYSLTVVNIEPSKILTYSYAPLVAGEGAELLKKNPGDKELQILNYASAKALLAFGTSLIDPALYYRLLEQAIGAAGGDASAFEQQVQGVEQTLGFSIKNDLVPALGNEFAILINSLKMTGTMPAVEGVVVFSVADKEKLGKVTAGIDKLAAQMGGGAAAGENAKAGEAGFKKTEIEGAVVKTLEIPGQTAYSPGYALDENYFLIGTSLQALKNAIETRKDPAKGLIKGQAFQQLAPTVTAQANSVQYLSFEGLWDTVRLFAAFAGEDAQQVNKIIDALQVVKIGAAASNVREDALVTNGILLLGEPKGAAQQ